MHPKQKLKRSLAWLAASLLAIALPTRADVIAQTFHGMQACPMLGLLDLIASEEGQLYTIYAPGVDPPSGLGDFECSLGAPTPPAGYAAASVGPCVVCVYQTDGAPPPLPGEGSATGLSLDVEQVVPRLRVPERGRSPRSHGHGVATHVFPAKYACGASATETPELVPANYATVVNIVNVLGASVTFTKRATSARPQREARGEVGASVTESLDVGEAIGMDCTDIRDLLGVAPGEYMEGFVLIEVASPVQSRGGSQLALALDVTAVHSTLGPPGGEP